MVFGVADKSGQRDENENGNRKPAKNIGKDNGYKSERQF